MSRLQFGLILQESCWVQLPTTVVYSLNYRYLLYNWQLAHSHFFIFLFVILFAKVIFLCIALIRFIALVLGFIYYGVGTFFAKLAKRRINFKVLKLTEKCWKDWSWICIDFFIFQPFNLSLTLVIRLQSFGAPKHNLAGLQIKNFLIPCLSPLVSSLIGVNLVFFVLFGLHVKVLKHHHKVPTSFFQHYRNYSKQTRVIANTEIAGYLITKHGKTVTIPTIKIEQANFVYSNMWFYFLFCFSITFYITLFAYGFNFFSYYKIFFLICVNF